MAKKVRWGVLGSGGIARRRTIPEGIVPAGNAELVAVHDVAADLNATVAAEFDVKAVESVDELLGEAIDAVYIATPAYLHFDQALRCARAKKHVLCEKPLGLTVAEAEQMEACFENEEVKLGVGFMMRFASQHREALRLVQDGSLGQLVYGRAQLSCWYPPMDGAWRQTPEKGGGGSLMDMGGHCIDLLEMFFGKISKVSCFTANTIHDYRSEDSACALLTFDSGATATVDTFFCIPDNSSKNMLELYGSKGSIIAQGTVGQEPGGTMVAYIEEPNTGYDAQQQRSATGGRAIGPKLVNTYRAEVEEFSQAILEDRDPLNNAELGVQSQKVLSACYESARAGRVVKV